MSTCDAMLRAGRALMAIALFAGCSEPSKPVQESLFDTGLCVDRGCSQIASDVLEYEPRFELWANTASKRRWIQIPPGAQIVTSDMDQWVFPVGTKVWKEFTRDGVRVETRYIAKTLADDNAVDSWSYAAFEWNADQTDTHPVPDGSPDANGTMHDIPSNAECKECHEQLRPSRLLGFEAIQLDFESPKLDLRDLVTMGLLSAPPPDATPYFPLPGTEMVNSAFGYLHANCSNCHSATSYAFNKTALDLRLLTTKLGSVTETPTYLTTVNAPTISDLAQGVIVLPHDPDHSVLIQLMNEPGDPRHRMPPLATEIIDPRGQSVLRAWIDSL